MVSRRSQDGWGIAMEKSLRQRRFGNRRGGTLNERLGFLIGHPTNQHVLVDGLIVSGRLVIAFGKRRHFGLCLAKNFSRFLRLILPKQAHGTKQARGSRYIVCVASRMLGDGQGLLGGGVSAVAILRQTESQFIPWQRRVALSQLHRLAREIERLGQQDGVGGGPQAKDLGSFISRPRLIRPFSL